VAADDSSKKGLFIALGIFGGCGCLLVAIFGLVVFGGFASFVALGGGAIPAPPDDLLSDEQIVREALAIPPSTNLLSLTADPMTDGAYGREGLRIVATFEMAPAEGARYVANRTGTVGWANLPLPPSVAGFPAPPVELPAPTSGLYFCQTGIWTVSNRNNSTFTLHPCSPPPADFDHYRAAVFDATTHRLSVVFKNYY